ncbi:CDT protein a [Spatholobus suberectus]|nr:CDT protein a [Spatholobus suberectus]
MKNIADQTKKVQCFSSRETSTSSHASYCLDNQESEKAMQKGCAPLSDDVASLNKQRGNQKESFSMSLEPSVINTPVHMIRPPHSVTCNNFESPDTRNIPCAADSFMTETPAQSAPARLLPISDVKLQNTPTQKSTSCHKPAKRVLDFTLMEGNDGLDIRVDKLESSRGCSEGCNSFGSVPVPQEAHFGFEKITQNQAGLDTQLTNGAIPIGEVEEQIESLEKLVPDWICKKSVLIGDMYCINKVSDLDSIRSRLSSNETV